MVSLSFSLVTLLVTGREGEAMGCGLFLILDIFGGSFSLVKGTPNSLGSKVTMVQ